MLRKGRAFHLVFLLATLLAAGFLQFVETTIFARLQLQGDDWISETGRKALPNPALVYLAIDEPSQRLDAELDIPDLLDRGPHTEADRRALGHMAQVFPWNREVYALVIEKVLAAGARVVAVDMMFPKSGPGDDALRTAIERHKDRVVVVGNIVRADAQGGGARKFTPPAESIVPEALRTAEVIAFANFTALVDNSVRGAIFRESIDDVNQATTGDHGKTWLSLAAAAVKKSGLPNSLPEDFGLHRIRFAGPAGTFRAQSVYEIFAPAMWKNNFGSGEFFRDKIVVIGPHGNWTQDEHLTTLGIMPGPELHLNAINAVLSGEFCRMMSRPFAAACLIGAALLAWTVGMLIRKPALRLMCILAIPVLWWMLAMQLYNRTGDFIPTVAPILVFALIGISGIVADQVFDRMEKARVRRTLERYVSKNVVSGLLNRRDEFATGIVMPVTILFSDIRNFTRFSAQTEPTALVAQLNEYFAEMVECVFAHGGTVDKFMGDAVMAVWGNATSLGIENDAQNATQCAFAMHAALSKLNHRWSADGRPLFDIGIALNHGKAVVGDIGSPNKMEFTVIGDAVNVAWRLQERTKEHPGEIVIGDTVTALVAGKIRTEPGGVIRVGDSIDVPYSIAHLSALKSASKPK